MATIQLKTMKKPLTMLSLISWILWLDKLNSYKEASRPLLCQTLTHQSPQLYSHLKEKVTATLRQAIVQASFLMKQVLMMNSSKIHPTVLSHHHLCTTLVNQSIISFHQCRKVQRRQWYSILRTRSFSRSQFNRIRLNKRQRPLKCKHCKHFNQL